MTNLDIILDEIQGKRSLKDEVMAIQENTKQIESVANEMREFLNQWDVEVAK